MERPGNSMDAGSAQLDSFDAPTRREALAAYWRNGGDASAIAPGQAINLHAHTFFSYNAYGYSPSRYALLARQKGLALAGIVDFDVLDGLSEFVDAGRLVGLKTCVSIETRVFVPEFSTRVINSPGEPGVAYHMGVGFSKPVAHPFLVEMKRAAQRRTRDIMTRVNAYLAPAALSFEADVLALTPNGNATERHLCEAYERKAIQIFSDPVDRAAFWKDKLGDAPPEGAKLQNLIRAKTMKKGGAGYVQPDSTSFPLMADMNRFVLDAGAIPTFAWLDGTSEGEQAIEEVFEVGMASGTAALNIIPDRNYTPGVKDQKLRNLYEIVALAEECGFPVIVGTEMNAPGLKFVDSFETEELKPLLPIFLKGAHIVYGHTVLQGHAGLGYLSPWANATFRTSAEKNSFYERVGIAAGPVNEGRLDGLDDRARPNDILARIA
jgi:hypothetical protein